MTEANSQLAQAASVARSVQIERISMQSATFRSGIDPLAAPEELTLTQSHRTRYELPTEHPNKIFVFVDFDCSATKKAAPSDAPPLSVTATYLLVYAHPETSGLPSESLDSFARLNGVYNAWPYWRELIQTASGRAGVGPIVIPVFRASSTADEPQKSPE